MPGDTLVVLGREYDNVAGVKAYDDNGQTLTYIRPQGTKSISSNGTGIDVTEYASVDVAVPSSSPNLQAKTNIAPTESSQTITADTGYDGLSSVQINAMPSNYVGSGITRRSSSDLTSSTGSDNSLTITAPTGYYSSDATDRIDPASVAVSLWKSAVSNNQITVERGSVSVGSGFLRLPSQVTVDPVTVSASELVSGTKSITSPGTTDVTNYASASVATGSLTVGASKGTVLSHSISVSPYVDSTSGFVGTGRTSGTAVTVSASELVSGSETKTENGTYDVTNLAQLIVNVSGGGGGSGVQVGTATASASNDPHTIVFSGLSGEPTSFVITSTHNITPDDVDYVSQIVYDGSSYHTQEVRNISNQNAYYASTGTSSTYSNGTLTVTTGVTSAELSSTYNLIYTYGGSSSDIGTSSVQVGSGATSITFTGLEDEPIYFSCIFKSNFSTSSGYQRVIGVAYDGTNIYGMEMDSTAKYSNTHWSYTYNNGSLTISSSGTNAGGYFHQPGYYQLTYAIGEPSPYQTKSVTYTPTTSAQTATITADTGYDALGQVNVTVNAIPSQYIVPTGNIAITSNTASGSTLNVSQYATATVNVPTGGGSLSVDTKTVTASNYPVSVSFSSMKGEPKYFFLRSTSQISSSGNTTYYYIIDLRYNGNANNYCDGNVFRIGSTRRVDVITTASSGGVVTGYTWSYSGTTLTITSSAASRSASPGAFNNTYELVYLY